MKIATREVYGKNLVELRKINEDVMTMEPFDDKWRSFNWNVIHIDGHNISDILEAFDRQKEMKAKPTVIIANKMDKPYAEKNLERMTAEFKQSIVIPCCAEAELMLERAEE